MKNATIRFNDSLLKKNYKKYNNQKEIKLLIKRSTEGFCCK